MRPSTIFAASIASFASMVQARIGGIGIPSTIKAGDHFHLVIIGQNYIQRVTDVSIAVGYTAGVVHGDDLGTFITAFDLVKDSNVAKNYNKTVALPSSAAKGAATFSASLDSLYGVGSEPTLQGFKVNFTIGDATSKDYVYGYLS